MAKFSWFALALVLQMTVLAQGGTVYLARPDLRRCAYPLCGGFFLTKVNFAGPAVRAAVADFSKVSPDVAALVKNKDYGFKGLLLLGGSLVNTTIQGLATKKIIVDSVYIGMPGVNVSTAIQKPSLSFYQVRTTTPKLTVSLVNYPATAPAITISGTSKLVVTPAVNLDLPWQRSQVLTQGAIFTAVTLKQNSVATALEVFIKQPVLVGPCTRRLEPLCPGTPTYSRGPDLCINFQKCLTGVFACPAISIFCNDGYHISCWSSLPFGCPKQICDPDFVPPLSRGC